MHSSCLDIDIKYNINHIHNHQKHIIIDTFHHASQTAIVSISMHMHNIVDA